MGCCQPAELINYDYSKEDVLKSYNLTSSTHYKKNNFKNTESPRKSNDKVHITTFFQSPNRREVTFKDFQTPTERKSKNDYWSIEEIDLKNLINAYKNEDLRFLFTYVRSDKKLEENMVIFEHKWAKTPKSLGSLTCGMISSILTSYLNEEVNLELFEEVKRTLIEILEEGFLMNILQYFKLEMDNKKFDKFDYGLQMVSVMLDFFDKFNEKDLQKFIILLIDYMLAFNIGFKDRKIETILVILDIFRKIHEKTNLVCELWEHGLILLRTLWFVYEISKELYIYDDQLVIWFRILNFIDETSKREDKRLLNIELKFQQGNIKDLLMKFNQKIIAETEKNIDPLKKQQRFDVDLLEYIKYLLKDMKI